MVWSASLSRSSIDHSASRRQSRHPPSCPPEPHNHKATLYVFTRYGSPPVTTGSPASTRCSASPWGSFSGALFGIHFRRSGVIQLGLHGGGPPPCCGGIVIQAPPATDGGRNRPRDTQRPDRLSFYAPPAGEEGRLPRGRIIRSASVERPLGAPEALGIPVPFQGSTGDLVSEQLPGSGGFVIHPRTGAHQNGATRGRVWLSP